MINKLEQLSVQELPIHLSNNYAEWLVNRLEAKQGSQVVTLNAEMAILAQENPDLATVIKEVDLVIPDGAGIVIYLGLRGKKQPRCPGIELAQSLLEILNKHPKFNSICFYGGKPGVTQTAAKLWHEKLSNLSIFTNHGYLSPEEETQWLQTIQQKQPNLILVGLGVPRQEFWIKNNRHLVPEAIWIGVGGSFDIWAGVKTRAPQWLRNNHLEWLYRLYKEPWRWRRMLALPQFFWQSLSDLAVKK